MIYTYSNRDTWHCIASGSDFATTKSLQESVSFMSRETAKNWQKDKLLNARVPLFAVAVYGANDDKMPNDRLNLQNPRRYVYGETDKQQLRNLTISIIWISEKNGTT